MMNEHNQHNGNARELMERLGLQPHPEGGFYRELYRSAEQVARGGDNRACISTIYYLLEKGQISRWHVVASDEVWHFLAGDPLELLVFDPESGRLTVSVLGPPLMADAAAVGVVPARHWQAARPLGRYALTGCTVGPGFDFTDFRFVADVSGHETWFDGILNPRRDLL